MRAYKKDPCEGFDFFGCADGCEDDPCCNPVGVSVKVFTSLSVYVYGGTGEQGKDSYRQLLKYRNR